MAMKRFFRTLGWSVLTLVIVIVLAAGALDLWLRTSLPTTKGTIEVPELSGTAEIARDRDGLVHIRADSTAGAYYALGYAHAQDRLWQMEAMRMLGAGRLSEIAGRSFIEQDRLMRTLGIGRLADAAFSQLSPEARSAVEAYTRGVNAFMSGHKGALSPEFMLLLHTPDPWRPADCLIWGRIMALSLSGNWRGQLVRARMAEQLSGDQIDRLYPPYPANAPVTVADGTRTGRNGASDYRSAPQQLASRLILDALAAAVPEAPPSETASNSWVIAASRSASGKPLLANDPHLGFRAPNLWYLARMTAPGMTIAGATAPGVPFHVLGHNGAVAWGMTTTGADTQDLVTERLLAGDPTRYITPNGPQRFVSREEVIKVRAGTDVRLTVRETRNGPIVSDLSVAGAGVAGPDAVLALRSPVLAGDDGTGEALFRINLAQDWRAFTAALETFHSPVQNIFYADTAGHIGFSVAGRVPVRRGRDGRFPADGSRLADDWAGYIRAGELPRSFDPSRGYFANANNRVAGPAYGHTIARDWEEPWRAIRLEELLAATGPHDAARAGVIQMDTLSAAARALLPVLLRQVPDSRTNAALLDRLRNWDFRFVKSTPEPLIISAWTARLMNRLFADELGPLYADFDRVRPLLLIKVLQDDGAWCDDTATPAIKETCPQMVAAALDDARADLARTYGNDIGAWQWGKAHHASFRNAALDWLPFLGRLSRIEIPTDGDNFTLNRGTSRNGGPRNRFAHVHGATLRAIYDMADPDRALFALPGGQSGNPLSRHYRDLTLGWRDGHYLTLPRVPAGPLDQLHLIPARN